MVLSMERWESKVAVVTGASSGIGAAIATQLVENGVKVIGFARRIERIEELSKKLTGKKGKLYGLKVDLSKTDEILAAFKTVEEKFGPINILINNAGTAEKTTLVNGDIEMWKKTFDINLIALCVATREAIKSMQKHNIDGHIVHMNSVSGHFVPPLPGLNVYASSKHGVTALTETLRAELTGLKSKIKVTSVSPGYVDTELFRSFTEGQSDKLPSLKAEDIADAVIYTLSTPSHVQVHEITVNPLGSPF